MRWNEQARWRAVAPTPRPIAAVTLASISCPREGEPVGEVVAVAEFDGARWSGFWRRRTPPPPRLAASVPTTPAPAGDDDDDDDDDDGPLSDPLKDPLGPLNALEGARPDDGTMRSTDKGW